MPDQPQTIERIESDRRKREREVLLLLLLASGESASHARAAARLGHDPVEAAKKVWLGHDQIDQPGAAGVIAEALADAHAAGRRRAWHIVTGSWPPPTNDADLEQLVPLYEPTARQFVAGLWDTLQTNLDFGLKEPGVMGAGGGVRLILRAIREAFAAAGMTVKHPQALEANAERLTVLGYNGGMLGTYFHGLAGTMVKGFRHVSVLDSRTTIICRQRDGLTLPKLDGYWYSGGIPPLHWGCRSILWPVKSDGPWSSWRPTEPPMQGFGYVPRWGFAGEG